jgi:Peptidase inhibitor I78 family
MNSTELDLPISSLLGRKLRVVRPGEVMTQDIQPGRVTVHLGQDNCIVRIHIEAERNSTQ